jgi:ADP-heptose:LPS heptosyltransferase
LSIRSIGGAFAAADLALVNDTGVLHLAAAVGTPTLALFGPTDPRQWCPAAEAVRYLAAPGGDLRQLPVETVREAAVGLASSLAGHGDPPDSLVQAPRPAPAGAPSPNP